MAYVGILVGALLGESLELREWRRLQLVDIHGGRRGLWGEGHKKRAKT